MGLMPKPGTMKPDADFQEMYKDWLSEIEIHGINLTAWEEDFIESVGGQVKAGKELSAKQGEVLERIYTQRVP